MVKRTITITTILLVLSITVGLIIALNRASFAADDDIARGTSGTCSWVIDKDGVLTISPTDGVSGMLANNYDHGSTAAKWYPHRESITKVIINTGVKSSAISSYLFYNLTNCTEMDLTNLDTSNTTDMGCMFTGCANLTFLNLTSFNTSKVTSMFAMFSGCRGLTSLDVTGFDTSKVTRMEAMFSGCRALTTLDVTGFNTSKVTNMSEMFSFCEHLTSLDLTGFDTSKVANMKQMFYYCSNLTALDLSGFDTSNVESMYGMFWRCSSLTNLNVAGFNTSKVTSMYYMFCGCEKLTNLDVTSFNTSNVITMGCMFAVCNALTSIDVTGFNTSKVTNMSSMFSSCSSLTNLDVTNFDTSKVTDMSDMFSNCSKLTSLDLTGFNTSKVTSMESMFSICSSLTNLDVTNFDTSKVTDMTRMFASCSSLTTLDVTNFDTSEVTAMTGMFAVCSALTSLDVTGFNTSKVTGMEALFANCSSLKTIDISSFDTRNVTSFKILNFGIYENIFKNCNNLNEIVLGEQFDFDGNNINSIDNKAIFPDTNNPNYTNRWIREDGAYGPYTAEELINNYDGSTMAGTWIREIRFLTVTYKYTGIIPQNASDLPEAKSYSEGEKVIVAPDASAPGYTFSGWSKRGTFTMPAEDIEITGYFIKEDKSKEYKIEYYFDGEKDDSLDETMNAEIDEEISIDPQKSLNFNNTHYSLVSDNHKINVSENTEDNVIRVYYETDVLDYNNEESNSGDGISDKYQVKIIYKVQNGTWNDGTSENKKQIINLYDKDGKPAENGTGKITTPEVGSKPNEGYKEGSWNIELPNEVTSKDNGKEYIYSYAKIGSISKIKGNLSNPKTDDVVQSYAIYGAIAILLMLVVKRTINKYSRKKRKIQF